MGHSYENQVLFGLDLGRRGYWRQYGGPGRTYVCGRFTLLLRHRAVTQEQIIKALVWNPPRAFAFTAARLDTDSGRNVSCPVSRSDANWDSFAGLRAEEKSPL